VQESVKEWAHTLPNGLPFWESESLCSPEFSKSNLKGQNSLDSRLPYIIRIYLKCRCIKWACMIHLSTYNTSYGWKKGQESKCQFESKPLKVNNHPKLLVCRCCATYHWKALNKGYNFALKHNSIKCLHKKLWASKQARIPNLRISGLPTWESWEKWHLGATPMVNHRKYYKGEGGGFPQIQAVVSLVSFCMPVARPCNKSASTMH